MSLEDATRQVRELSASTGLSVVEGGAAPVVNMGPDVNQTAKRLGEIVSRLDLFRMNGELVFIDHERRVQPMAPLVFRTWINDHVVMAAKFDREGGRPLPGTLGSDDAAAILRSQNFLCGVRPLRAVNQVRLPVLRGPERELDALPWGYDAEFQVYTVPGGLDYDREIDLAAAKVGMDRIDGQFPFSDGRSRSVQRAADLALFCKHLPGGQSLRPGFLWLGNKPGSGKSVLAKKALYPVLGSAAAAKMKKGEELDKELEAFARARVPYIFMDNIYGGIASASIDQMLTSRKTSGRAMGGHGIFEADNTALLLVTGNKLELNEDAARRFLVVDLFEKGEPDGREVTCRLDDDIMETDEWRARMLSYLWSMCAHWHAAEMPKGKKILPTYEAYSELLGGVVAACGYEEPFQKAIIPDAILPEKAEFGELLDLVIAEMEDAREKDFTLEELACLARAANIFTDKVGTQEEGRKQTIKDDVLKGETALAAVDQGYLTPSHRTKWSRRIHKEVGGEPRSASGKLVEFGHRSQGRKSTFTVVRLD
jgi:hypothetical protein